MRWGLLLVSLMLGCFVDETLGDEDRTPEDDSASTPGGTGGTSDGATSADAGASGMTSAPGDEGASDSRGDEAGSTGAAEEDTSPSDDTAAGSSGGPGDDASTGAGGCGGGGCPLGCTEAHSEQGRGFVLCDQRLWDDAREQCQEFGGDLARVDSEQVGAFLAEAADVAFGADNGGVWIGLHDRDTEGEWQWLEDEDPYWVLGGRNAGVFAPWDLAFGEPNDLGGEDCGAMIPGSGLWNDASCVFPRNYICDLP